MKYRTRAAVALGLAAVVLAAGAATGATAPPTVTPGIPILPALPEPGESQFVPGATNVVPPTAAPATDIGKKQVQSLAAPFYACSGFSGIEKTSRSYFSSSRSQASVSPARQP